MSMSSKIPEPTMSVEAAAKHASSEAPKVPLVVSGVARRKRGPQGRETSHPIAVSFSQRSTPQAGQSTVLNGQRAQIASQKLAGNMIDWSVPRQSGLNPSNASSTSEISAKIAPKAVQATTDALPKA